VKRRIPVSPADAKIKLRARLADYNARAYAVAVDFDDGTTEYLFFVHSQDEADNICRWLSACQELRNFQTIFLRENDEVWQRLNQAAELQKSKRAPSGGLKSPRPQSPQRSRKAPAEIPPNYLDPEWG